MPLISASKSSKADDMLEIVLHTHNNLPSNVYLQLIFVLFEHLIFNQRVIMRNGHTPVLPGVAELHGDRTITSYFF